MRFVHSSGVIMAVTVTLTADEIAEINRQDPATASDGGFQSLIVSLQSRINPMTGELHLTDEDMRRIPQYAFDYGNGGWENILLRAFARTLGQTLGL